MSVNIGPRIYGADGSEPPSEGNPSEIDGDLDMQNYRIVNLSVGIVSDWFGALNNAKVDWGGGTMTGDLIMGGNKIREVGDLEDDQDVVNKRYFMHILLRTKPYDLGRYISYFHILMILKHFLLLDLDSDKVFEIFNSNVDGREIMRPKRLDGRTLALPKKEKTITIFFLPLHQI